VIVLFYVLEIAVILFSICID